MFTKMLGPTKTIYALNAKEVKKITDLELAANSLCKLIQGSK
jgi:hypothetical protein